MDKQVRSEQHPAASDAVKHKDILKESSNKFMTKSVLSVLFAVVIVGVATGFVASYATKSSGTVKVRQAGSDKETSVSVGEAVGSDDLETFKDTAEGVLKEGGIDGEGEFHLERPGGKSQNVYLTSSIVDLSEFESRKVKVWGQTYEGEHAGWLMDVGRVQVLE